MPFGFDFIGRRKLWFIVSGVLIGIGLLALLLGGLNLGIDFTGGTILELQFEEELTTSRARQVLGEFGLEDSVIQLSGGNMLFVRTAPLDQETITAVHERFDDQFAGMEIMRTEMVGPTIGEELRTQALYALLIATILIVAYISYRFEFRFAIAAIIAVLHDVLIVVGLFALIQWQVNSPFIAGLLTIMGYSINDTIVIFDKIRENEKLHGRRESFAEYSNRSLNETLTRSINTSLTTMLVTLALFIFGGATIRPFILTLLVGIVAGTYSSMFVASPILASWNAWDRSRKEFKPQHG